MIAPFGYTRSAQMACGLMFLVGAFGLVLTISGRIGELAAMLPGGSASHWLVLNAGRPWITFQSMLVMVGGIGAFRSRSFALAFAGIVAALMPTTPLVFLTFLPGLWLLILIVLYVRATPRWKGEGPPPLGSR
jgi:hypothetical protein